MNRRHNWPWRYRLAYWLHCRVNGLYRATGKGRFTGWLNAKVGRWWIDWYLGTDRWREGL